MPDPQPINELATRAPTKTAVIPAMEPGEDFAHGLLPHELPVVWLYETNRDPTPNDDASAGHFVGQLWRNTADDAVYQCWSVAADAALWIPYGSSVVGLTNPLTTSLNASNKLIYNAPFSGFKDNYYDLAADAGALITGGVAALISTYNAYKYPDLAEPLEIQLPDHTGVPVAYATFGVIAVSIAPGGSVTVSSTDGWGWEKADPSDADPVIPSAVGSAFRLRYSFDPVTGMYAVSLSHLPTSSMGPSGKVEVVTGSVARDTHNINADTHVYEHEFVSTVQDGTVYLFIAMIYDGSGPMTSEDAAVTPINNPPTGSGSQPPIRWYWYKPTQGDLDTGSKQFTFGKANEAGNFAAFEVKGADASNPVSANAYDRSTSATRTSMGPVTLPADNGALLVSCGAVDLGQAPIPDIAVNQGNGFTHLLNYDPNVDGIPAFILSVREVTEPDTYPTPSYTITVPGTAFSKLEAFTIAPEVP